MHANSDVAQPFRAAHANSDVAQADDRVAQPFRTASDR